MKNDCRQFRLDKSLQEEFPDEIHSCNICAWRSKENPNECAPPGYGCCATEDSMDKSLKHCSNETVCVFRHPKNRDVPCIPNYKCRHDTRDPTPIDYQAIFKELSSTMDTNPSSLSDHQLNAIETYCRTLGAKARTILHARHPKMPKSSPSER